MDNKYIIPVITKDKIANIKNIPNNHLVNPVRIPEIPPVVDESGSPVPEGVVIAAEAIDGTIRILARVVKNIFCILFKLVFGQ
jgi:hypothetical protein